MAPKRDPYKPVSLLLCLTTYLGPNLNLLRKGTAGRAHKPDFSKAVSNLMLRKPLINELRLNSRVVNY
jgi:hypothetical protein